MSVRALCPKHYTQLCRLSKNDTRLKVPIALEEKSRYSFYNHVTLEGTGTSQDSLTRVLEVDVIAVVRVLELVGHHAESHDLLPDQSVRPRDVHVDLGVVDLVGQPIIHDLRQVSAGQGGSAPIRMRQEGPRNQILPCWLAVSQTSATTGLSSWEKVQKVKRRNTFSQREIRLKWLCGSFLNGTEFGGRLAYK